jgi:Transglycosylase SLT domain
MDEAIARIDNLERKSPNVRVTADTAGAETKLAAVAASEDKVAASNKKITDSSKPAVTGMGAIIAAAVALGPAIVPITLGAAGLAVGFGAMGAAGIAAMVGIKQEMAAGTPLGVSYTTMLGSLSGDLQTLGHTAAAGVLGPFQHEVATLQTQMPQLNNIIGEFSVITGKTAGNLVNGLISAFIAFEPLAREVGVYVLTLSQRFASLMTGPGVASFGSYIQSVFPQVMATVESVVGAVVRLVAAIAPMGMGSLGILKALTDAINLIPVNVLSVLAQVGGAAFIAFKSYGLLSVGVSAFGVALKFVGVSAESAAVGLGALNIAAGAVAVVIGIAMLAFSGSANAARDNQQAIDDYTTALIQANGAIDANVRSMTVKNLSDSGAIDDAKALGLSLSLVTDAALGSNTALAAVTTVAKPLADGFRLAEEGAGPATAAFMKNGQAAKDLLTALGANNTALKGGQQAFKDQAAAMATSSTTVDTAAAAAQRMSDAQQTITNAADAATQKMRNEQDAAGVLKQALDLLNGKAISAAQAQNSFDTSLVNMGTHTTATGKKIVFTTTSIQDMSSASVSLRGELLGQVTNMQNVIEANGGLSKSTVGSRAEYELMRQKIIDNAVAHGVNRAAVIAFIDTVLKTPTNHNTDFTDNTPSAVVRVKKLGTAADTAAANRRVRFDADVQPALDGISVVQARLNKMHDVTVHLAVQALFGQIGGTQTSTWGPLVHPASGGFITGPGTGTSDSIPAMISNGEYVVKASQTAKYLPLLNAINRGAQGYAAGGHVLGVAPNMGAFASSMNSGFGAGIKGINIGSIIGNTAGPGVGGSYGTNGGNQAIGLAMMLASGYGLNQWPSLKALWTQESGWNASAVNPSSGAWGIPQSLPASKMASAGADYLTNPATQIRWGLGYIGGRYGSPARAWAHEQAMNWYGNGTNNARPGWAVVGDKGPELMNMKGGETVVPNDTLGGGGRPVLSIENYNEAHRPPSMLAADLAFLLRTS